MSAVIVRKVKGNNVRRPKWQVGQNGRKVKMAGKSKWQESQNSRKVKMTGRSKLLRSK